MTGFDDATANVMGAAVMLVVAIMFVTTSVVRRDTGGARIWALSYLLSITGVLSYYVWWIGGDASWASPWALGLGYAATVGATGTLMLGCRAFNREGVEGPAFLVASISLLTATAAIVEDLSGTAAAPGSVWLFAATAVLSLALAYHAVRGRMRRQPMAWVLAGAAAAQGVFAVGRAVTFLAEGGPGPVYEAWFGQVPATFVLVTVGLVLAISTFVLRSAMAGTHVPAERDGAPEVLPPSEFMIELRALLRRAGERVEGVAVIAVRTADVEDITVAFGRELSEQVKATLRTATRRFAPPIALVGESERSTVVYVATMASSQAEARRQAGLIYRGVIQEFVQGRDVILPGIGVGVSLSQTLGYRADVLVEGARAAAAEAGASEEASVVFATVRDLAVNPFPDEAA